MADAVVPRKRSAIDTLVAKDRVAVFWFIAACLVGGLCAWYLVIMAETLKARPPFVIMDGAGAFYVAPGINFDQVRPMHVSLTELAVETLFVRGPEGLAGDARVPKLWDRAGMLELRDIVHKEDPYFIAQQVRQTVEIEEVKVGDALPTAVITGASGKVYRHGVFNGVPQDEVYRFTVYFKWKLNPDIRGTEAFPAVIHTMPKYNLERVSEP